MKVYAVIGLDSYAEYSDEDFVYEVCSTKEVAKKYLRIGKEKICDTDFWIEVWEVKEN